MNLKAASLRISRREIYNLKNIECQNTFKSATDKSYDLRACMKLMLPLSERADAWKTSLKSHISRSFKKIRVRKSQVKASSSDYLIDKRNKLTKVYQKEHSVLKKQTITTQIANIEIQIAQIILKEGLEKAYKFRKFCNASSSFPVQEMWKFKNKLWPKKASALPVAKLNEKGRMVSTPKELMKVLLMEYKDRLRPRCNRSDLKSHIQTMHEVTKTN